MTDGPFGLLEIAGDQHSHRSGRKRANSEENPDNKASDDEMIVVSNTDQCSNAESKMGQD